MADDELASLVDLLADCSMSHLQNPLAGETLATLSALDRMQLLAKLKDNGVQKLSDRQCLANALGKASRAGRLKVGGDADVPPGCVPEALASSNQPPPPAPAKPPACPQAKRLLFVGNSLTFWLGGLDKLFQEWGFLAEASTIPGATLQHLWMDGTAKGKIREGGWDVVILQDDLPEYPPGKGSGKPRWKVLHEELELWAGRFVDVVKETGATPLLYMTWEYSRLTHTTQEDICTAHKLVEQSLGVAVAPAGLGHVAARESTQCDFSLLDSDREHPSLEGRLLNGMMIAATLVGGRMTSFPGTPVAEARTALLRTAVRKAQIEWEQYQPPARGG